ncbi:MAG: hypothetical protein ACXACG_13215 [Candidatus Thorarchaeota archaeon]|jgi:hypothetical protein
MAELLDDKVIKIVGLDKTRKDMIVLGALLKAQKDSTDFIDFETLREQLSIEEGSKKGKDSLIYRSLSWLDKEGFLKIDKSSYKHGYNSGIAILEGALARIVLKKTKILEKELKQIDSEVVALSEMESDIMASGVIDLAAGKRKLERPVFAQGWENIVGLVRDKVYKNLKMGDIVRVSLEWLTQTDYMNPEGLMNAEKLLEIGVEFRSIDYDRGERKIRDNFRKILVKMNEGGYKIGYRIFPRKDATYQFIARNTEGIVLVVSESPLSATWLPRSSNPELVENAIDNFDSDYELGTDLLDFEG